MQLQNLEKKRRKWLLSNEMMDNFFSLSAISRFQEMPALYLEKNDCSSQRRRIVHHAIEY